MIGYVTIGVNDIETSKTFYLALLEELGAKLIFDMSRIAFIGKNPDQPMLAICVPYNEEAPLPGNGNMFTINGDSNERVDRLYHKAITLGASCEGKPGERIANVFYGGYVRDLDGNKLAFAKLG